MSGVGRQWKCSFAVQLLKCATLLLASHQHKEFSKGRARQLNSPRVIFYTGKCLPKRQQVNNCIMQQQTRLVAAAEAGRVGSVRSLLQAGANADTPDAVQRCMLSFVSLAECPCASWAQRVVALLAQTVPRHCLDCCCTVWTQQGCARAHC